jgi:hypothetical protein
MLLDLALEVPRHETELDLPQSDDVKIGDVGPVIRSTEPSTVELTQMKFAFPPPARRKGGPVFNFRSEGRHFADSHRCLIPAKALSATIITEDQLRGALGQAGLPDFVVNAIIDIKKTFDAGYFDVLTTDVARLSGRAPKSSKDVLTAAKA